MVGAPHQVRRDGVVHPRRTQDGEIRWADGTQVALKRRAERQWGVDGELVWRLGVRQELSSRRLLRPFTRLELVNGERGRLRNEEIHGILMIPSTQLVSTLFLKNIPIDVGQFSNDSLSDMCFFYKVLVMILVS